MSDDEARRFIAEHAHYTEDLAFWRAQAARLGSPVLDLGAAAGRVALDLARAGHAVWALDRSPDMLAELGRRLRDEPPAVRERVTPVQGDLAHLELGRRFPLVIVAMNTLQVLTDPGDRAACFRGVREHLADGGEFAFDVALPDVEEIVSSLGHERPGGASRDPETGDRLVHSAWYDAWDPATATLEFTLRVRRRPPAGGSETETLRRHRVHLFTPQEIAGLMAQAGLEPLSAWGDFAGGPIEPWSERQVHRCRRAA